MLPPKTRKLLQQSVQGVQGVQSVQSGTGSSGTSSLSALGDLSNTTKRQQLSEPVDGGVSVVRIGGVNRSLSNVGSSSVRTRVPKPVRRSKSHLTGGKFVTNITHGGSVTLVSLNNQQDVARQFQPIDPDLSDR